MLFSTHYSVGTPEAGMFSNQNVNPIGSNYADIHGHATKAWLQKQYRDHLYYDISPKQFLDLAIMAMKTPVPCDSDEFFFKEIGYSRSPIIIGAVGSTIAAGTTQSNVPVANTNMVAKDMLVIYPNNERGIVSAVDTAAGTINIRSYNGMTLPAIPVGAEGATILQIQSTVEADATDKISVYSRYEFVERFNWIQLCVRAMRFGRLELGKLQRTGGEVYLQMNKAKMIEDWKVELSNSFINGKRGEVITSGSQKAKTTDGIFPTMQRAGSPHTSVSLANTAEALRQLAFDTEYGSYGDTRFIYCTPLLWNHISEKIKGDKIRWTPGDNTTMLALNLPGIDFGSQKLVHVPMPRFADRSSFPDAFRKRVICVDMESVTPRFNIDVPESWGETHMPETGQNRQTYKDIWVEGSIGVEYSNPLAGFWLDITDAP